MKDGAEAVNVASLPDGRTLAIKISDGNATCNVSDYRCSA